MKTSLNEYSGLNLKAIQQLQEGLNTWFLIHGRHWIPWKLTVDGKKPRTGEILCAYRIWIAEVMLQQTQLNVVLPFWKKWMANFPSIEVLANARESEVLIYWQGLGYYSRARRLHDTAKIILRNKNSQSNFDQFTWPSTVEEWMNFPGIGRTTAGSIVSSAFDSPAPILDGNVKRVLSRLFAIETPLNKNVNFLWDLSNQLLDRSRPRDFNQALMDLGATTCLPRAPNCISCPLNHYCLALLKYDPKDFPVKEKSKKLPFHVIGVGIIFNDKGEVLIDQRLESSSLGGMWEFPGGKREANENIEFTIFREIQEELAIEVKVGKQLITLDHSYSHKKLQFIVHICTLISGIPKPLASQQCCWVNPKKLNNYAFPAANAKIIIALNQYIKCKKH